MAQNFKPIPKCDPHETDHISILEKIRKLECRLNSAESELSNSKVQILTISDNIMNINSRVQSFSLPMLYGTITPLNGTTQSDNFRAITLCSTLSKLFDIIDIIISEKCKELMKT